MSVSLCSSNRCETDTVHLCSGCGLPYCVFCLRKVEVEMGHSCPVAEHEHSCSMMPDDHIFHLCEGCYPGTKRGAA